MKRLYFLALCSALALGALGLLLGLMRTGQASVLTEVTALRQAQGATAPAGLAQVPVKELVIGLGWEPRSLYYYDLKRVDDWNFYGLQVLEALQDGPIDTPNYDYVPVILVKLPDVVDGDAALQNVTVNPGNPIVENGEVVTYTGSPTTMQQLVATFTLRSDVRWCDGQPLTALDSAFSFQVQQGTAPTVTDHTLVDRTFTYTQQSTYTTRWAGLPGYIDSLYFHHFWTPLPYHVLSSTLPMDILDSDYARAPLGWGPFCFTEWTTDHITLDRNPYYWQPDLPKLDRLIFRWNTADEDLLADIIAGRVQVGLNLGGVFGGRVIDLNQAGALQSFVTPSTAWEHIDLNVDPIDAPTHTLPFTDVQVRQAILYGTDRQRMIDEALYGLGAPADAFVPDLHPAYPSATLTTYPYSPTLANALLDAAGWEVMTGGMRYKNGQPLAFIHRTTDAPMRRDVSLIFQENMAAIGVSATLEFWAFWDLFADGPAGPVKGRWFDSVEYAWLQDPPPELPGSLYLCDQIPTPDNGWEGGNFSGYCSPAYDTLASAALNTLTRTEQLARWQDAIALWTQELPALPLFYRVKVAAATIPDLIGFEPNPTEFELWDVELWDTTTTGALTVDGGELHSNSSNTKMFFSVGAVDEAAVVHYVPQVPPADLPPGLGATSHFFELEALGEATGLPIDQFDAPVSVTVRYNDVEIADLFEDTLAPYRWTGSEWEKIGSQSGETYTLDIENNLVTAQLLSFSRFGHFAVGIQSRLYLPLALKY